MSTSQIRQALIKQLETADEKLLKMIYALVEVYEEPNESVFGYDADGNPKSAIEMKRELSQEFEEAKKGKYISLDELKKRSEKWLNSTK